MTPIDQMSERSSALVADCICSGAMYVGEPMTALASVACVLSPESRCP